MDDEQQPAVPALDGKLESVRDRAIAALIPLLDELDDSPERKFDVCLSAVRSADRPELLEKALQFAEEIEDKSQKAKALIDVANEAAVRIESGPLNAETASA